MYDLSDTIVAVSTPAGGVRSIIRITGPQTPDICARIFNPAPHAGCAMHTHIKPDAAKMACTAHPASHLPHRTLCSGSVRIDDDLAVDALLYLFVAPHSYTGEDLAEIHLHVSQPLVEALLQNLLSHDLRLAGPGEFTARAYLNGKLDLAQAEAVNEVISSSNRLQLDAAERVLSGRLTAAAEDIRSDLLDVLSLLEAGLDFSGEDIEFISTDQAVERLTDIQGRLEELLAGSIRCETLMDLPAVGIAGAPNAGKSTLLNALLGWERSIVAPQPKTTRDVLSGILTADRFQCVLFDCAGLIPAPESTLDNLAQQAAIAALQSCHAVIFCVDSAKSDRSEDITIRALIAPKNVIHIATKCDLPAGAEMPGRLHALARAFQAEFLPVSATARHGLPDLFDAIETCLHDPASRFTLDASRSVALTARHRQAVTEAIESVRQAITEVRHGREEVAVTMLRTAHQAIAAIEQQPLDEQILDRIFSRFCVGK